jgi:alanine racemase
MTPLVQARIDLGALRHNLACARAAAPRARVMAVIKADAYGHGMLRVARALHDADAFGVARVEEALNLRAAGVTQPIVLLEGVLDAAQLSAAAHRDLSLVLHHAFQVDLIEHAPENLPPVKVWVKLDSGMHRLGFVPAEIPRVVQRLRRSKKIISPLRFMTHLANADDRNDRTTLRQLEVFQSALAGIEGERSIANSAGIMGWPQTHADWVRPGIMLYGVSPFLHDGAEAHGLRPVMTLSTRLIALRRNKKGDAIGYGGSYVCPRDMLTGVAAIGYGDGYPRHAQTGTPVLVNGRRAPLIGRVSMDMITVDLSAQPEARIGDPVVLWGDGLAVEEVARCASTIAYELLCGVARRVAFVE